MKLKLQKDYTMLDDYNWLKNKQPEFFPITQFKEASNNLLLKPFLAIIVTKCNMKKNIKNLMQH